MCTSHIPLRIIKDLPAQDFLVLLKIFSDYLEITNDYQRFPRIFKDYQQFDKRLLSVLLLTYCVVFR